MKSLLINPLQIIWILGQGVFLPLALWVDDLREAYGFWSSQTQLVFTLLEMAYLVDAVFFIKIFGGKGKGGR